MTMEGRKSELVRLSIFDTIFNFIANPRIKNIRVYGILDENNKCENPLFHGCDLLEYARGDTKNCYRYFKKLREKTEILLSQKLPDCNARCNLITEYGLIKVVGFCKGTIASISLSQFIYALFDLLKKSDELKNKAFLLHSEKMVNINVEAEIEKVEKINNGGIIYFIQNTETKNIKIGRTDDDIETRLTSLQVGNDCPLLLLRTIECNSRIIEKQLHEMLLEYHVRGEWFRIDENIIEKSLAKIGLN